MRLCLTEWKLLDKVCKSENIARSDFIELIENRNSSELGLTYYTRLLLMLYFYHKSPMGEIKNRRRGMGSQSFVHEVITSVKPHSQKDGYLEPLEKRRKVS